MTLNPFGFIRVSVNNFSQVIKPSLLSLSGESLMEMFQNNSLNQLNSINQNYSFGSSLLCIHLRIAYITFCIELKKYEIKYRIDDGELN